jgi:hypothetical protein
VRIHRDREKRTITLDQSTYIQQMLQTFGMDKCRPVATTAEGVLRRLPEGEGRPDQLYMSIVGSLLYAAMITRPDIAAAVQMLSRHLQRSGPEHLAAAKRVLRYLLGTIDMCLVYGGTGPVKLVGYSDADWAGDPDTRRSTTGYTFTLGRGSVSWESRLQPTVALSSCESEYVAASTATQEAVHLRLLLSELGFPQEGPTIIYEDNQGTIALSENPMLQKRTKHVDIRYHFVREKVLSGEIKLVYIPTQDQVADILTKPLQKQRIIELRSKLMGVVG